MEKKASVPTVSSSKKKAVSIPNSIMILVDFLRGNKWPNILFNLDNAMPAVLCRGREWIGQRVNGLRRKMQDATDERNVKDARCVFSLA